MPALAKLLSLILASIVYSWASLAHAQQGPVYPTSPGTYMPPTSYTPNLFPVPTWPANPYGVPSPQLGQPTNPIAMPGPPGVGNGPYPQPPSPSAPLPQSESAQNASAQIPSGPSVIQIQDVQSLSANEHHLGLRVGPFWNMITPSTVSDQSPTKLKLDLAYGYNFFDRQNMSLSLLIPLSLQINPKSFYENSLISFMVGLQFEMRIVNDFWLYGYLALGLGTGFVHVGPDGLVGSDGAEIRKNGMTDPQIAPEGYSMSQTGLATHMGLGVKIKWPRFDLSLEPVSIPLFHAFGPGSRGSIASWAIPIGAAVHF